MRKWLIVFIIILSGCKPAETIQTMPAAAADKEVYFPLYYTLTEREKSPFEPENGCLVGAQIVNDKFIDGSVEEFEKLTNKSHEIYNLPMKALDPFPMNWALSCFANKKIPMVTLYPQSGNMPFDTQEMHIAASTLSTLRIPMIVRLYPNPEAYGDNAEKYAAFFREAREIFRSTAPQIAFVWSISPGEPDQCASYYPGDEYVDYIGLQLLVSSQEGIDAANQQLAAWNYAWQNNKPLMLFTAVSHYSTKTTIYTEQEGASNLKSLYTEVQKYPQMKAIIYIDDNLGSGAPVKAPRENYLLTDNQKMLEAYHEAINIEHFSPIQGKSNVQWLKSPFDALEQNGRIFIPVNAVKYDLLETMLTKTTTIHGREYISQDAFNRYKITKSDNKIYITPYSS